MYRLFWWRQAPPPGWDLTSSALIWAGETVLGRSIRAFEESPLVSEIVLVAGKNREYVEAQAAACTKPVQVVQGVPPGRERQKTVCWPPMESWWLSTMQLAPL